MGLPKLWGKDSDGSRGFVFSHVKTIYYNWAQKKLLSTKLDEIDALIDKKIAKAMMSNVQVNDQNKVPTSALAYAMQQQITENENAISVLNSDKAKAVYCPDLFQNYQTPIFVKWDANTLNTPYKAGITAGQLGFAFIYGNPDDYFTVIAAVQSERRIYSYSKNPDDTYDWDRSVVLKDINPVYKVLNLTSQFNSLGTSYSLKMYGFVYIHLGFTTTRQPSEGDDIVQLIDTGDIAPVSNVAFTSRQGGYATFKIDPGSKNLRIGGTPPEANHAFVIDAIFKRN